MSDSMPHYWYWRDEGWAKGDQDGEKDDGLAEAERGNLSETSRATAESRQAAPGCLFQEAATGERAQAWANDPWGGSGNGEWLEESRRVAPSSVFVSSPHMEHQLSQWRSSPAPPEVPWTP